MITTSSYQVFTEHRLGCVECNPKELRPDVIANAPSYQSSLRACPAFALAHAHYRPRQRHALPLKKRAFFCGAPDITLIAAPPPQRRKCPVTKRVDTY